MHVVVNMFSLFFAVDELREVGAAFGLTQEQSDRQFGIGKYAGLKKGAHGAPVAAHH